MTPRLIFFFSFWGAQIIIWGGCYSRGCSGFSHHIPLPPIIPPQLSSLAPADRKLFVRFICSLIDPGYTPPSRSWVGQKEGCAYVYPHCCLTLFLVALSAAGDHSLALELGRLQALLDRIGGVLLPNEVEGAVEFTLRFSLKATLSPEVVWRVWGEVGRPEALLCAPLCHTKSDTQISTHHTLNANALDVSEELYPLPQYQHFFFEKNSK